MRRLMLAVLLGGLALSTSGCIVAIGTRTESPKDTRIKKLEERMDRVEDRLGIEHGGKAAEKQPEKPAEKQP